MWSNAPALTSNSVTVLDGWDRARAIRTRLAAIDAARAGMRLLALLPSIHHLPHLGPLAELVLPAAVSSPSAGAAVARLWDDAFGRPWESPSRVTELVMPVIATPALLAAVLDEVAAPDEGTMRERTRSALELLGSASAERDVAAAALIARLHADRTRADDQVGWREATCRALRKLADHRTLPTAILELAASGGTARRRDDLLALLADLGGAQARTALAHLIDRPDLAVATVKAVGRSSLASPERHARFIGHPFWKIRLAAADSNRNYTEGKLETYAVWAAIEAAGLAVPVDDRRWARSDRDPPGATWDELAAAHGTPITLTPLPPARAGADSSCADYRAWSLWALDERADPADAVVRVVADELDRALCGRGHARHGGRWSRWRERLPELPTDRAGRLAWARARGDDALSSTMAGVLDGGADDVAATLPGSMLTLSAAERADLEGLEAPLVERGRTLFRDGVLPRAL